MSANNNGVITGGGFYGRDEPPAAKCRYGNNAFGHNPECPCLLDKWRTSDCGGVCGRCDACVRQAFEKIRTESRRE